MDYYTNAAESCFFVFSFVFFVVLRRLRPETAPLKISSFSKEGRKKSKTFFSFFLSFVKEKNFNFNDHS